LGAALPTVFENIVCFSNLRDSRNAATEIGISFVAMRRNIADLPVLIQMSSRLGASRYMVTNVLPYTKEMCQEMLYARSVDEVASVPSPQSPRIDLPRIDLNPDSQDAIIQSIRYRQNVQINGVPLGQEKGRCPFVERGSVAVSWDGAVSPCLALMHHYISYLHDRRRSVERHTIGNLMDQDLKSIWEAPDYVDFRKRVQAFDFSPCIWCGGCSWSEKNQEDCFANTFPTCGGCLWAQGVIRCP
jgi:MoaA/NifB/PqqE/SkfB family radical SAM enzyme